MKKINLLFIALCLGWYTLVAAEQVAAPVFNLESGRYDKPVNIMITCDQPGAQIYYTLDGSAPNQSSYLYTGLPVVISNHVSGDSLTLNSDNSPSPETEFQTFISADIKAIAVAEGMDDSEVVEAKYVLDLVDTWFDIPYADPPPEGGDKHKLDVYQPSYKTGNPVLLFIHGGAWKQGDKDLYMELGNTFAGYYNITTVIASYQLSSDPWNVKHPTHVMDVAMAFAWVVDHIAEYGGDPEQIHIMGQSAGAHLCALLSTDGTYLDSLGLSTDRIKSAVLMSGAYNLYDLVAWPVNPLGLDAVDVLGYKTLCQNTFGGWDQETLDAASPGQFVNMNQPPCLLISLTESGEFVDMPGFVADAKNYYDQIKALNGPQVELQYLVESDIPQEILDVDFPGETEGHYEEIYAINTKMWDTRSTRLVAEYLGVLPDAPALVNPVVKDATELTWYDGKLAGYYHVQIATDPAFSEAALIFDHTVADTCWQFTPPSNGVYYWRVSAVNGLGESGWSESGQVSTQTTSVEATEVSVPSEMSLLSVYPNPFNGMLNTHIRFNPVGIGEKGEVRIYDLLGRQLYVEKVGLTPGQTELNWKTELDQPSGVYFVVFQTGQQQLVAKAVMIK